MFESTASTPATSSAVRHHRPPPPSNPVGSSSLLVAPRLAPNRPQQQQNSTHLSSSLSHPSQQQQEQLQAEAVLTTAVTAFHHISHSNHNTNATPRYQKISMDDLLHAQHTAVLLTLSPVETASALRAITDYGETAAFHHFAAQQRMRFARMLINSVRELDDCMRRVKDSIFTFSRSSQHISYLVRRYCRSVRLVQRCVRRWLFHLHKRRNEVLGYWLQVQHSSRQRVEATIREMIHRNNRISHKSHEFADRCWRMAFAGMIPESEVVEVVNTMWSIRKTQLRRYYAKQQVVGGVVHGKNGEELLNHHHPAGKSVVSTGGSSSPSPPPLAPQRGPSASSKKKKERAILPLCFGQDSISLGELFALTEARRRCKVQRAVAEELKAEAAALLLGSNSIQGKGMQQRVYTKNDDPISPNEVSTAKTTTTTSARNELASGAELQSFSILIPSLDDARPVAAEEERDASNQKKPSHGPQQCVLMAESVSAMQDLVAIDSLARVAAIADEILHSCGGRRTLSLDALLTHKAVLLQRKAEPKHPVTFAHAMSVLDPKLHFFELLFAFELSCGTTFRVPQSHAATETQDAHHPSGEGGNGKRATSSLAAALLCSDPFPPSSPRRGTACSDVDGTAENDVEGACRYICAAATSEQQRAIKDAKRLVSRWSTAGLPEQQHHHGATPHAVADPHRRPLLRPTSAERRTPQPNHQHHSLISPPPRSSSPSCAGKPSSSSTIATTAPDRTPSPSLQLQQQQQPAPPRRNVGRPSTAPLRRNLDVAAGPPPPPPPAAAVFQPPGRDDDSSSALAAKERHHHQQHPRAAPHRPSSARLGGASCPIVHPSPSFSIAATAVRRLPHTPAESKSVVDRRAVVDDDSDEVWRCALRLHDATVSHRWHQQHLTKHATPVPMKSRRDLEEQTASRAALARPDKVQLLRPSSAMGWGEEQKGGGSIRGVVRPHHPPRVFLVASSRGATATTDAAAAASVQERCRGRRRPERRATMTANSNFLNLDGCRAATRQDTNATRRGGGRDEESVRLLQVSGNPIRL